MSAEETPPDASPAWRFGFVPTTRVLVDRALAERLAAALGPPWQLVPYDDYAALVTAAAEGQALACAWLPPVAFARARRRAAVTPLFALARAGRAQYVSALVVPQRAAVRAVSELRGARAAWVDRWSAAGYLMARRALRDAGIDPDHDLSSQTFVGSYTEVIEAVAVGRADFGAVYCSLDADGAIAHAGWTVQDELRPVALSAPIPGDVICALPALPAARLAALTARFESLAATREGQALLRAFFGADALAPVDVGAYALLEDALDTEVAANETAM